MVTTTQAAVNKSEKTDIANGHINDPVLATSSPDTKPHNTDSTTTMGIANATTATANNTSTTYFTTAESECSSNDTTAQNIKLLPKASPPPQVVIIPVNETSTVATNAAKKIRRAFSIPRNPFRWSHKFKTSGSRSTTVASEHKSNGKATDAGGGETKGSSSGISGLSSITKSYTLSSCVGGKRERAESFVSLKSNDDNYVPAAKNSAYTTNAAPQTQSSKQSNQDEEEKSSGRVTKNSIKKFATKSNTINGVSSLSNSSTLPTGASLFSTLPAGASNSSSVNGNNRVFRRSSFRKFLNRIAQHITTSVSFAFEGLFLHNYKMYDYMNVQADIITYIHMYICYVFIMYVCTS